MKLKNLFLLFSTAMTVINPTKGYGESADNGESRGGGKGIVCKTAGRTTVKLLDYEKGRKIWKLNIKFNTSLPGKNEIEKIVAGTNQILDRLYTFDPVRATDYKEFIRNNFFQESEFVSDYNLFMIQDSKEDGVPKNCSLELIVLQKPPIYSRDKRFLINEDLWKQLSLEDKIGTVIHETTLYESLNKLHRSGSDNAIYYNAVISSAEFANFKISNISDPYTSETLLYSTLLKNANLPFKVNTTSNNCSIMPWTLLKTTDYAYNRLVFDKIWINRNPDMGHIILNQILSKKDFDQLTTTIVNKDNNSETCGIHNKNNYSIFTAKPGDRIWYYPNGTIAYVNSSDFKGRLNGLDSHKQDRIMYYFSGVKNEEGVSAIVLNPEQIVMGPDLEVRGFYLPAETVLGQKNILPITGGELKRFPEGGFFKHYSGIEGVGSASVYSNWVEPFTPNNVE